MERSSAWGASAGPRGMRGAARVGAGGGCGRTPLRLLLDRRVEGGGAEADAGEPEVGEGLEGRGIADGSADAVVGVDNCVPVTVLSGELRRRWGMY